MAQKWQGRTDGNRWMQQQLINGLRYINLRVYYTFVAIVVPFYIIFGKGFSSSYDYFRHRLEYGRIRSLRYVYLQFFRFGQVVIDRFACYGGKRFQITIAHNERFQDAASRKEPFIMLSGHIGNYEIAGHNLVSDTKTIHTLVYAAETETIMKYRENLFPSHNIKMIPVLPDMSHIFAINNALRDGDIVSIPADRCEGSEKFLLCTFMGAKARIPMGPFSIIAMRDVTTIPVFVVKEGVNRYHIYFEQMEIPSRDLPKTERIQNLAQQYACAMEKILRKYPEQWFNFFNYWS